jgi:hypothetical protein
MMSIWFWKLLVTNARFVMPLGRDFGAELLLLLFDEPPRRLPVLHAVNTPSAEAQKTRMIARFKTLELPRK